VITCPAVLGNCTLSLKYARGFSSCVTQKTHSITITKTSQLPLLTELVVSCSDNHGAQECTMWTYCRIGNFGVNGTVRYGTLRYGTARYGTVRYGKVRYGKVRYGTLRHGTARAAHAST